MASVSPLCFLTGSFSNSQPVISSKCKRGFRTCLTQTLVCRRSSSDNEDALPTEEHFGMRRRQVMLQIAVSAFSSSAFASTALAEKDVTEYFQTYTDDQNKFKIAVPQDWQIGKGGEPNGFKSITAFYPVEPSTSNISVVITGLGPDFTKMESFGKVDEFAETLVSGLDRSWQKPVGVAAKLIDSKSSKGFYYIEYTLQNPGESRKHLYSAIGMAANTWYNRLYTVTGQFDEEDSEKYGSKIRKAVTSFRFV